VTTTISVFHRSSTRVDAVAEGVRRTDAADRLVGEDHVVSDPLATKRTVHGT
jgi:phosphopantothenate synthetase